MEQTCVFIAPVLPVLTRVSCTNETLTNATKHYETHQYMSLGSKWGGSGVFVAKNFDAISCHELLHLLHQFNTFCTKFCAVTKQIQNAHKQYETHQYCLGSNEADRVCLLQKIPMRLHGTNLCINCTSSTHFAPSSV